MIAANRPLPTPTAWSAPYWAAARECRFIIQECRSCQRPIMYPKRFCPHCLGDDLSWRQSPGRGEIYSVTVQHAGAPTGFAELVPFAIAIIRLDEGVRLMSNIVGPGALEAACGDRVIVDFRSVGGGEVILPVFRLDR
jgi:uncharacterized OB-fold protein